MNKHVKYLFLYFICIYGRKKNRKKIYTFLKGQLTVPKHLIIKKRIAYSESAN